MNNSKSYCKQENNTHPQTWVAPANIHEERLEPSIWDVWMLNSQKVHPEVASRKLLKICVNMSLAGHHAFVDLEQQMSTLASTTTPIANQVGVRSIPLGPTSCFSPGSRPHSRTFSCQDCLYIIPARKVKKLQKQCTFPGKHVSRRVHVAFRMDLRALPK